MKFSRSDYNNRIVDLENKIPEDEPCFLLRANDILAPKLLLTWAMELRLQGGDPKMAAEAEDWAQQMLTWQKSHDVKLPNMQKDSAQKQFILDRINEIIDEINDGELPNMADLQNWIHQYYDRDDLLMVLMPCDLKQESMLKSIDSLTFDDFELPDEIKVKAFDVKLIVYRSKFEIRILKNDIS